MARQLALLAAETTTVAECEFALIYVFIYHDNEFSGIAHL